MIKKNILLLLLLCFSAIALLRFHDTVLHKNEMYLKEASQKLSKPKFAKLLSFKVKTKNIDLVTAPLYISIKTVLHFLIYVIASMQDDDDGII